MEVRRIVVGSGVPEKMEYSVETTLRTDAGGRIKVVLPSKQVADPRVYVSFAVSQPGYAPSRRHRCPWLSSTSIASWEIVPPSA